MEYYEFTVQVYAGNDDSAKYVYDKLKQMYPNNLVTFSILWKIKRDAIE